MTLLLISGWGAKRREREKITQLQMFIINMSLMQYGPEDTVFCFDCLDGGFG